MSAASAAAMAPATPPCVARIFDRVRTQDDDLIIPANYGSTSHPESGQVGASSKGEEFWRDIAPYRDVSTNEFLSWAWSIGVGMTLPG